MSSDSSRTKPRAIAFDSGGRIANTQLHERFEDNIIGFMDLVEASKHYPCVKTRWVEYLGDTPIR